MPLLSFSIALPTKDRAFLIGPLIEGILSQDFQDFSLIFAASWKDLDCNIKTK